MENELFDRINNVCAALMEDTPERDKELVFYWADRAGIDPKELTECMMQVAVRIVRMAGPQYIDALPLIMSGVGFGLMSGYEIGKADALNETIMEGK